MTFVSSPLAGIDLNLLVVLRELLRERNVTRAAECLGVTQPAASAALSRLRRHFNDDLLVRRHGRYELSALAVQLAEQIEAVCDGVEQLFATAEDADPARSRREFKLVIGDYGITVLGAELAHLMSSTAPHSRLSLSLAREGLAAHIAQTIQLVDGVISAATFHFHIPEMRSSELFRDRWVCIASADNPRFEARGLTHEDLTTSTWVVPYHSDTRFPSSVPVSSQLALLGVRPVVGVRVESHAAVPHLVAGTDHIALVQERLAVSLRGRLPIRVLECPQRTDPIVLRLWWHERYDEDHAHQWFRALVTKAARAAAP
jgi:DNA-binding transcriptional LysR family regulator